MSRKNKPITDLKYNTKRRIDASKRSIESIAAQWGDVDMFIAQRLEDILSELDEIREEVHGVNAKTH